jgi:glycosyltransferase involved in cell wall biosynthesis
MKLSVVVPAYNEAASIRTSLARLLAIRIPLDLQVVVVENGSSDGTLPLLERLIPTFAPREVRLVRAGRPLGKGAAVLAGMEQCDGEFFLVHDADLEYDPGDIPALLAPLLAGRCDLVNGTRFGRPDSRFLSRLHGGFSRALTTSANLAFAAHLTDLTSCYKAARLSYYRSLGLRSRGFSLETEVLCRALRRGHRVLEVPIRYLARTSAEGKKIRPRDLLPILAMMARIRLE